MATKGGPHHRHSQRPFSIAVHTTRLHVDNRFSLGFYRRTAENLLKQANIYREERNIIELYILLLRYSSLVGETIPEHQHYRTCPSNQKAEYRKTLTQVLDELEFLKPRVQKQVEQINKSLAENLEFNDDSLLSEYEWPPRKRDTIRNFDNEKIKLGVGSNGTFEQPSLTSRFISMPVGDQLQNLSLNLPIPKEETLSRHSFLGSSSLRGQWQIPRTQSKVQYPIYIDSTPIQVPSVEEIWSKSSSSDVSLGSLIALDSGSADLNTWEALDESPLQESSDIVDPSIPTPEMSLNIQPSPPVVAAPVKNIASMDVAGPIPMAVPSSDQAFPQYTTENMSVHVPPWDVADPRPGPAASATGGLPQGKGPKRLHISVHMMDEFLKLAKYNTNQNLETCGVLAGSLKKGVFYVTTLIIPKQQATSDSCQTINEEEIFDCQDKRSLFQLGWIHTHPTQTCFMSSIDLHTHYSYQVMLPEAVAIVMAPTDASSKYGIFRLSDPGGIKVIQQCQMRGFHPHEEPPDGGPIYEHCANVFIDTKLRFQVIDLR